MIKQEGFKNQWSIVLPEIITKDYQNNPINRNLYITDIGYYPDAKFHQRTRNNGCNQFILIYCIKGQGWVSLGTNKFSITAGHYFIIPKNKAHAYGSSIKNPWSIYWVHFSGELASQFYDPNNTIKSIPPSKTERKEERLQLFEEIMYNLEMGYSKENLEYANICLLHFLASLKYINQYREIKRIAERDTVEKAIFFMRKNLDKEISLNALANEMRLSVSHLSLKFRKKTGRAPMDYLIHLRIQRSCQLLDNSNLKVNEIIQQVGYEDPFYFSRIFKKIMGVSPINYRNKLKG